MYVWWKTALNDSNKRIAQMARPWKRRTQIEPNCIKFIVYPVNLARLQALPRSFQEWISIAAGIPGPASSPPLWTPATYLKRRQGFRRKIPFSLWRIIKSKSQISCVQPASFKTFKDRQTQTRLAVRRALLVAQAPAVKCLKNEQESRSPPAVACHPPPSSLLVSVSSFPPPVSVYLDNVKRAFMPSPHRRRVSNAVPAGWMSDTEEASRGGRMAGAPEGVPAHIRAGMLLITQAASLTALRDE
ncbi:hypothetical protein B0H10DRAFT_2188720 [Mycena sp. CBHHK59/15]|nr:hypothetical protein B0H10DRAFT_2188720 [Mycena sp. CBHHK59/15]